MKVPSNFGFYAILTDPLRGYEYCTQMLIEYQVPFIQLRVKDRPKYEVLQLAEKLSKIVHNSKSKLIINDYPDIACRCGAHGVHLGQEDIPYKKARQIVGDNAIIGLSTHNPEQTRLACLLEPDYIGIGPVFPTPSKKIPDPVIGIAGMKNMLALATVPAVVIGGITIENLPSVLEAGAKNFSFVRPLNQSPNPQKVLTQLLKIVERSK